MAINDLYNGGIGDNIKIASVGDLEDFLIKYNWTGLVTNSVNTTADPLLSMIPKKKMVSELSKVIVPSGTNGGISFGDEVGATAIPAAQMYDAFTYRSHNMYAELKITDKDLKLGNGGAASVNDIVKAETKSVEDAIKLQTSRALYGSSTGKLAAVSKVATGKVLTVDDKAKLTRGMLVDIYTTAGVKVTTEPIRILHIDPVKKTNGYEVEFNVNPPAGAAVGTIICLQGSYGKEVTGLLDFFDDSITKIYNIDKTSEFKPQSFSFTNDGGVTEIRLNEYMTEAIDNTGAEIDTLVCSTDAYFDYARYLRETNYRVEESSKMIGGFKVMTQLLGDREVAIMRSKYVPSGQMWAINTKDCEIRQTGWDYLDYKGSLFQRIPNRAMYTCGMANYWEFLCKHPGHLIKFTDCVGDKNDGKTVLTKSID